MWWRVPFLAVFAVASFHAVFLHESACDVAPFGEATGLEDVLE